jgi:cell shape-determining protein MreC
MTAECQRFSEGRIRNSQLRLELYTESLYSMVVLAFALFSSGILFFLSSIYLANAIGGSSSTFSRNNIGASLSPSYRSIAYFINWARHLRDNVKHI